MEETNEVKRIKGTWNGQEVNFKAKWGEHDFTDEEVAKLLNDEVIEFEAISKSTGNTYPVKGKLEEQEYEGKTFVGFKPIFETVEMFEGMWNDTYIKVKRLWGKNDVWEGHRFTDDEVRMLLAGETIEFEATSKKGNTYTAKGKLEKQTFNGRTFIGFKLDFD